MEQTQQNPVPNGELQSTMMSIIEAPNVLLCLKEPTAYLLQELIAADQKCVDHICAGLPRGIGQQV